MTFIRAKEIPPRSGNWYDYEVQTIHEGKKVIQKVIRYIGKSSLRPSRSGASDKDYKVSLYRRKSVKKGKPVFDANLTPVEVDSGDR